MFQAAANWPKKESQEMGRLLMMAWLSRMAAWKAMTTYLGCVWMGGYPSSGYG
jgi:hypothetical protein